MAAVEARMQRPQRWDVPFDAEMDDAQAEILLAFEPFRDMDPSRFPRRCSLVDILRNDTRLVGCEDGDIVIREGDYGSSAFLILTGSVRVILESLSPELLGRASSQRMSWWDTCAQLWRRPAHREVRRYAQDGAASTADTASRTTPHGTRIFLQDVPGVLEAHRNLRLPAGELFGELAALSRTPRTATVIAEGDTQLLEIRWQGLRDIMRYAPAWKQYINRLYRENSLQAHLRETKWLRNVSPSEIRLLADATSFETYGAFDWHAPFQNVSSEDVATRLDAEPLIASEGTPLHGVLLIRSGFARLSHSHGAGQRTCAYLGKGDIYGLGETAYNWRHKTNIPLQYSLRAVGYVDVLRIPMPMMEKYVLPRITSADIDREIHPIEKRLQASPLQTPAHDGALPTGLLEFFLDHRTNNGAQTMLIDLNRCTRCDDCVRACAATHDQNPRFVRSGPQYDNIMVAQACMHCADPVCMIGCPTGAISRDLISGTVVLNDNTCIGCGTCANSCPYQNIQLTEVRAPDGALLVGADTGVPIVKATKCDLCSSQPLGPACQRACPHDALIRMNMRDTDALHAWLTR